MFIPTVPFVPHTTIVNKTIVYSDTVLPLKDAGSNLKVTSISNVGEFSLESCLETIFKSNPNVVFNTIQYSKSDKKVYFYTNAEISKKAWENSNVRSNYAYFPIVIEDEYGLTRDELYDVLKEHNIFARKYFYPATNEIDCYRENANKTPIAADISRRILTLPMYPTLEEKDIRRICKVIKEKK